MGKGTPEARRRASAIYYQRNRAAIREKRNAQERANPRKRPITAKVKAAAKVRYAVWSGKLVKPSACQECGAAGPVQGHHHDYDKPLDVRWLCASCHAAEHAHDWRKL